MVEIDIINKSILTSIFLLGFLIGAVLTVFIYELRGKK
jgi:hypothetical protein